MTSVTGKPSRAYADRRLQQFFHRQLAETAVQSNQPSTVPAPTRAAARSAESCAIERLQLSLQLLE
jgi:hypothetical protein